MLWGRRSTGGRFGGRRLIHRSVGRDRSSRVVLAGRSVLQKSAGVARFRTKGVSLEDRNLAVGETRLCWVAWGLCGGGQASVKPTLRRPVDGRRSCLRIRGFVHAVPVGAGLATGCHKQLLATGRQRLVSHLASREDNVLIGGGGIAEAGRPS